MANKALISEYTWRSIEMQRAAFPDMKIYVLPQDLSQLMRPTTRQEADHIHVMSLGVIADNEKDFREFLEMMAKRKAWLRTADDEIGFDFEVKPFLFPKLTKLWKAARRAGIQKIGGRISAQKRMDESKAGADKIKDRWGTPSKTWPTRVLLKEADMSYNTAIKFLGKRPIAQYNYQAKLKRQKLKEDRANV